MGGGRLFDMGASAVKYGICIEPTNQLHTNVLILKKKRFQIVPLPRMSHTYTLYIIIIIIPIL